MARIPLPEGEGSERQRLWPLRAELTAAADELASAVYTKTSLPPRVREVVRLRIAQINDCPT
jgi:alkylhydroperoxidase family enzyme